MVHRRVLLPTALGAAALFLLSACGGEPDQPASTAQSPPPATCPSAEKADELIGLWASDELEKLEARVESLIAEDKGAAPCQGADELTEFLETIGPAIALDENRSANYSDGHPDTVVYTAFNKWLTAIGREDVNLDQARRESKQATESAEAASDKAAVLAGRDEIDFAAGECTFDWICDMREFYDDEDPTNGTILLETQFSDEPGFSGTYFDDAMRAKVTDWIKEWAPPQLEKVELYYYADVTQAEEPTDAEPYATIEVK